MEGGFTPWELASLKVIYHRFDDSHKGYLDVEDLRRVCAACHLSLTDEEFLHVVHVMDTDRDLRFSFDEFVTFLALSGPEHPDAVRLRAQVMRGDMAAMTAGAALGLLPVLKGKLVVLLGTLFYDPIRLFRDTFVDYSSTLRHRMRRHGTAAPGAAASASSSTLWSVVRAHAKESHICKTLLWLTYTVALDCTVGVVMFVTYANVRRRLIECGEVVHARASMAMQQRVVPQRTPSGGGGEALTTTNATAQLLHRYVWLLQHYLDAKAHNTDHRLYVARGDSGGEQGDRTFLALTETLAGIAMHGHPLRLEAVAGMVGGAAGGLCEGPCRYLATLGAYYSPSAFDGGGGGGAAATAASVGGGTGRPPSVVMDSCYRGVRGALHSAFRGTAFAMLRNAVGHAAFFSAFSGSRALAYRTCFGHHGRVFQWERTSFRDSLVTAFGGCVAGGAYRTVAMPLANLYAYRRAHQYRVHRNAAVDGVGSGRRPSWVSALLRHNGVAGGCRVAYSGYPEAMLYTMPVTGVAFLLYEMVLLRT